MQSRKKSKVNLCAIAFVIALAGCGGGGGGTAILRPTAPKPPTSPPPPPPAQTNPDVFRTAEFKNSWGLEAINAAQAYADGFTGEGVIIGIFDFNFDFESTEIAFQDGSKAPDPFFVEIYEGQIGEPATKDQHGQAVAVVAAGLKNDFDTHGVAFDATVLAVDFFSGVNVTQVVQDGVTFNVSNPWTYLTDLGV